ncbi:ABCA9 protein, partial [Nothoprocta ornata]|nr:ABCA9 protein [Nothoprocta pentlandii]NWX98593.1 ABCA9 protein [Nothoprocta ornata]
ALVDVPLYWALITLMASILVLFCYSSLFNATTILALIVCIIGYGISLVLHIYLIAFKFRNGRSNRYFWSFIIILISFIFYTFSSRNDVVCIIFSALMPWFPLLGWL